MRPLLLARSAAAVVVLAVAGCTSSATSTNAGMATMNVSVMDAPFSLAGHTVSAVDIALKKVELIGSGGHQMLATFSPDNVIDLLNYQTTPLSVVTTAIPAGEYQQFRLVLDTSSSATNVVVDGATQPLVIPSATGPLGFGNNTTVDQADGPGTSGIKVNAHFKAQGGFTYGFVLDFNAAESIVLAGGQYIMKPVLVATAVATSGAISGVVKNGSNSGPVSNAEVVAQQGGVAVNSGVTDANGQYHINALPAGTYTLVANNAWVNQAGMSETATNGNGSGPFTVNGVVVTNGQVTTDNITE